MVTKLKNLNGDKTKKTQMLRKTQKTQSLTKIKKTQIVMTQKNSNSDKT